MKNPLVVFEGLDGSGKTTQIDKLQQWFENKKLEVFTTKQPTDYYRNDKRVRDYLDKGVVPNMYSIALLAAADRTYQIASEISPKILESNIICDRYLYSSLAFFKARGIDYEEILMINKGVPTPDVTVFLDIPPERALERVRNRDGENIKYEEKNELVFNQVRQNFLDVLPKNTLIVDSTLGIDKVHQIIANFVSEVMDK
ncbi:Thymidylate kinase [Lactococcus lactis subsp. lactis]|uniref:dTMP kinase n=1 Tax=Lactococcus lactis TaxID=1358 RepID=UPI00071CC3BC|nr:dTMP kinase [Lactococcus lactis]KST95080.1 Thymidylate kinase [Lactococcus lactis subsp. lactis]